MTADLLAAMRKRDRLAKVKERRSEYKKLRNEIVAMVRRAQKSYINDQIKESVGDMKKHWKIIKQVTGKTNNKEDVTTNFYYEGRWIENEQENADKFNEYLANIGKQTNQSVGASTHNAQYYLSKHSAANQESLLLSDISNLDVIEACKRFSHKTSKDPSGFQQNILLNDSDIMAPCLAHLANSSFKTGIFPENGKVARVIPVYKNKGTKHNYGNYRPISLLPIISKIIERLIYNKVFDFLVRYDILFESQYGFRTGHNTTHAALDFVGSIEKALEKGEHVIGIFCDLSKAFDTLNHEILLSKLEHYGIRDTALSWFRSYLANRRQFVDWNGFKSDSLPLETGVPQGSILGPLLFLLYINDLPAAVSLKSVMFADDTNLLISSDNFSYLIQTLNEELGKINDYFKANQLKLNAQKTKMVYFCKKKSSTAIDEAIVKLDGTKLEFEESASFLGLQIDSHLNWDKHCTKVANTISRNNSMINRVKKLLPPATLKLLYYSFIQPHLQYGLTVWGGCSNQNKKRVISIQKRSIRTVCKAYFNSHTEPRMKKLGILKLEDLYKQQCIVNVHDCVHENAPSPIQNLVQLECNVSRFNLRSNTQNPLNVTTPITKSRISTQSFSARGPFFWNSVSTELKGITRKSSFKNKIKRTLLDEYQAASDCHNPRCTDRRHHH